jgi:subtilisin-like proprotein convertase family protein
MKIYISMRLKGLLTLLILIVSLGTFGQYEKNISYPISEVSKSTVMSAGELQINASNAKYYLIDVHSLRTQMQGVMHRDDVSGGFIADLSLPHPDGSMHAYKAKENSTLDRALVEKFPEIRTYDAGDAASGAFVKWDVTPKGLHAMIMIPGESTIYIDPAINGNTDYYIVYRRKDFSTQKSFECTFNGDTTQETGPEDQGTNKMFGTCQLRTYRLALSATGEYTAFHGGTVALALAAQATSMNRVNGVFEKDMAITMTIIPNNNLIVYTNATTDPFTNGTPGTMINQNQTNTDAVIGTANYDIGHVFGTNSGGLAGLGVVCAGGNKARGVTGSAAPIGDPFDIDYVAHEMGHQFGANHTQNNNCNRNALTAVEPGSASTIMGYAGICAPNVQNNSDDHFSGKSLQEISVEILSAGHTCEMTTALTNNAPIIIGTVGNVTVPANTPFALTANATDADGNPLTYNWEQMDNEVSTQPPVATSTGGPNFRSNPSSTNPTRYFPSLASLATNGPFTWEVVPSVSRVMDFRVTVRDNAPGPGSCNDHDDIQVTTDAGSGPFLVLYPTATGITWGGTTSQTVTWDVANTSNAPVACANVDILLSTDGGLTYPTVLATNVPNDGSQVITVPNLPSTTCRIMVICSNGTFFDISNNNFTITAATYDYSLAVAPTTVSLCQPNNALFTVTIGSFNGYVDPVTLSVSGVPAGATSNFSVNPVIPAGTSTLTISNTANATPGTYTLTVTGNSTSGIKTSTLTLTILDGTPNPITLTAPANGATNVAIPTVFTWSAYTEPGATYDIEIATDAGFTAIVAQASALASPTYTASALSTNTTYYWRVRVNSTCGSSAFTLPLSFTTTGCVVYAGSSGLPAAIPTFGTVTRTITVPVVGTINDVNVLNLVGTHTRMGDLSFTLTSPQGTVVSLMANVCGTNNNFDIDFDDAAASAVIPCPPTTGLSYQPVGNLSDFNGQNSAGTWTLTITDNQNMQGGSLTSWSLEICVNPTVSCTDPTLPVLSVTPSTVCDGQVATLTITGTLNSATNWSIYTGLCGGTLVGTTAGSTFSIPNATTQTYYVRGEDGSGCVNEAALTCANITLTATPVPSAPFVTVANNCGNSVLSATGSGLIWSTGETTASITVPSAGTYTVTQTVGGCTSPSASATSNPSVVPVITLGTLTNPTTCNATDGSIIVNGSGTGDIAWTGPSAGSASGVALPYTISGLGTGTYTIGFFNGCPSASLNASLTSPGAPAPPAVSAVDGCGSTVLTATGTGLVWSTGATTSTITVTTAGSYTVTQTVGGCTSSPANVGANPLSSLPAPSASVVNNCGSSTLSVVSVGSVLWSTGETTQTINVTAPGVYTVTETVGGCMSAPASVTAAPVAIPAAPFVTVLDKCGMSDLSTTASGTLAWSTSESTPLITVTVPGTYYVSQTVGGCTSAVGSGVANPLTIPTVTFAQLNDVCINTSAFTLSGGSPAGGIYTGTGVTSNVFDPSVAGYGVFTIVYTFTDVNGCSASNQQPITVGCAGEEELQSASFSVYPNPSNGQITITVQGMNVEDMNVFDATGKLVYDQLPASASGIYVIDLSELSQGVYSLEILSAVKTFRERVIITE